MPSPEEAALQRSLDARQRALDQQEEQLFEQGLVQVAANYARQLETTYQLAPEQARTLAQQQAAYTRKIYEAQRELQQTIAGAQKKLELALSLADENGLGLAGAKALMQYDSSEEMRMGAQLLRSQSQTSQQTSKEIAELKAQVQRLMQGTVTPQRFDSGQPGAVGQVATSDNIDKLFVDYAREHPGRPNPYEGQYRKFLGM